MLLFFCLESQAQNVGQNLPKNHNNWILKTYKNIAYSNNYLQWAYCKLVAFFIFQNHIQLGTMRTRRIQTTATTQLICLHSFGSSWPGFLSQSLLSFNAWLFVDVLSCFPVSEYVKAVTMKFRRFQCCNSTQTEN